VKIAIESSVLIVNKKTGINYYTQRLLQALTAIDQHNSYELIYLAFPGRKVPDFELTAPNVSRRRVWWLPGKLNNLLLRLPVGLPIDLAAGVKPDVFFFPNFVRWPLLWTKKSVLIVHDLSFIESGDTMVARHRRYLSRVVPQSIQRSSRIVTISESSKEQISRHYGTKPAKITVVTPAIDHSLYHPATPRAVTEVKQRYGIAGDYLLYLGTLEPRKNVAGIIRGYQLLPEALKQRYKLVLAGGKGWLDAEINQLIAAAPTGQILRPGYIEAADVPALYSGATIFLYPSHYEGWGMQVLEAMACGTPVITADNSSLPEVGGGAAAYVDSRDVAQLGQTIAEVLDNPKKPAEMRRQGLAHAAGFTWEASAQRLLEVFSSLA
jgi:glycosyltransferase involved in cell wall biosynthesis